MKGLNINLPSCTSENSTAIISSNMDYYPSSSSTTTAGGRAIDRHNPIITDEKRSGFSNSCNNTPMRTPLSNNVLQKKPPTPITPLVISPKTHQSPKKKGNNKLPTFTKKSSKRTSTTATKSIPIYSSTSNKNIIDGDNNNDDHSNKSGRRSFSKPSDLLMKASACTNTRPGVDYISPPESSRYLLDDTSFLKVLSDFDPVLKLVPSDSDSNNNTPSNDVEIIKSECSNPSKLVSSSGPSDQVVVLRVSLHCRGCEKKMKKHLSRMTGVRSFNIDFTAKKVTVVGDVTPLGVLASISKVKTAQLWTPVMQSSSQLSHPKASNFKNNQL